jgi:hypothetical protein
MFGQQSKRLFKIALVVIPIIPLILMFWFPTYSVIAFLIAVAISYRISRLIALSSYDQGPSVFSRVNTSASGTVLVQLVDDNGQALPPEVARAKLRG